ncbi:MAG: nicotinate (nicotinamide) nucleotide adenylyltransferase [Planctomycetes bacterium]|nr:nicotinate (nicotinamide) nucleotide adenylyltransferase [Planctomycetota bacterium]
MAKRKIALFGGTFDPVHIGHTTIAADAARHIGAEKIIFIPAKRSPLKGFLPKANDKHRLKMIALAIAEQKTFEVSDCELKKPAPSYTLDTVRKFQAEYGDDTLIHWLIGADSIDDLTYWYQIIELIDTCILITMYRAGCEVPDFTKFEPIWGPQRTEKLQQNVIQTPLIDISSTEIRDRLASDRDVTDMLMPPVAEYIRKHGLYQSKSTADGE